MFATSLTSVNINGLSLTTCNYDNITLKTSAVENDCNLYAGLIHIRFNDIYIDNFCFTNINDQTPLRNARVVSRGTIWIPFGNGPNPPYYNWEQNIAIHYFYCFGDSSVDNKIGNINANNTLNPNEQMLFGNVSILSNEITNEISQVNLSKCEGNVEPPRDYIKELFAKLVKEQHRLHAKLLMSEQMKRCARKR